MYGRILFVCPFVHAKKVFGQIHRCSEGQFCLSVRSHLFVRLFAHLLLDLFVQTFQFHKHVFKTLPFLLGTCRHVCFHNPPRNEEVDSVWTRTNGQTNRPTNKRIIIQISRYAVKLQRLVGKGNLVFYNSFNLHNHILGWEG